MNPQLIFWISFFVLFLSVVFLTVKYGMLRDMSVVGYKPYSWSRVQLAWWTVIILAAFIAIVFNYNEAPTLSTSTVILLGISAATTAVARTIDVSAQANVAAPAPGSDEGGNLLLDILSDQNSVSIPRFQAVVFNFVFGVWFIVSVLEHLKDYTAAQINEIMPVIEPTNLVLLGLSSATYAALKITENQTTVDMPPANPVATSPVVAAPANFPVSPAAAPVSSPVAAQVSPVAAPVVDPTIDPNGTTVQPNGGTADGPAQNPAG